MIKVKVVRLSNEDGEAETGFIRYFTCDGSRAVFENRQGYLSDIPLNQLRVRDWE